MEQSWETELLWLNLFYHNGNAISREKDIIKWLSILFSGKTYSCIRSSVSIILVRIKKIESKEIIIQEEKYHRKKYWKNRIKFCRSKESVLGILPVPHIVSV